MDAEFKGGYGVYHSIYDNFNWMEKFGDPEFLTHLLAARLYTLIVMRAAVGRGRAAQVCSLRPGPARACRPASHDSRSTSQKERSSAIKVETELPGLNRLVEAVRGFQTKAEELDRATAAAAARVDLGGEKLVKLNDALARVERAFLLDHGLPDRPWFKHAIYAPGSTTGYACWPLPAIRQALEDNNYTRLAAEMPLTVERIEKAAAALKRAASVPRLPWRRTEAGRPENRRSNPRSGSTNRPGNCLRGTSDMARFDSKDPRSATLPRVLGPVDAFCVVVGCTIGSGIFLVPATVAENVPFLSGIVLVWVIGGLFSLAGALTLAELGAMLPQAGGLYVYLRVAYGALPAFLFGWVEFLIVRAGSMATLAAAFARYFGQLCPPPAGDSRRTLAGWHRRAGHRRRHRGQRLGHAARGHASGVGNGTEGRRRRAS